MLHMVSSVIRISEENRKFLDELKVHPRQSYDEILKKLIRLSGKRIKLDKLVDEVMND